LVSVEKGLAHFQEKRGGSTPNAGGVKGGSLMHTVPPGRKASIRVPTMKKKRGDFATESGQKKRNQQREEEEIEDQSFDDSEVATHGIWAGKKKKKEDEGRSQMEGRTVCSTTPPLR